MAMRDPDSYVTVFVRMPRAVKEVLDETVRGMNAAREIGERVHSVNEMVNRCVAEVLAPAFDAAANRMREAVSAAVRPTREVKAKKPAWNRPKKRERRAYGKAKWNRPDRKALPAGKRGGSIASEVTRGRR